MQSMIPHVGLPVPSSGAPHGEASEAEFVQALLDQMTLAEKIGQLNQVNGFEGQIPEALVQQIRDGRVGSVLNEVNRETLREIQRIAVEESRLGIPLLIGRDVIHGFRTIFPIPLGQAATWDPEMVRASARIAAQEATAEGIHWTFAPMLDIGRDPRWGRVAESLGEDPLLTSVLGAAMVQGFQGDELRNVDSLASCLKHFAGYGASEGGRDYNFTAIPEGELRSVHLPPFKAALEAGAVTVMTSFSDLNGIPASANHFLLTEILRENWGFDGFVVSDWQAVSELVVHGLSEDARDAARAAAEAGVDMDMVAGAYIEHLQSLVEDGEIPEARLNEMVGNVLRIKFRLGLWDARRTHRLLDDAGSPAESVALGLAREVATRSVVLLKNDGPLLPLRKKDLSRVAVIGPLADEPREQLGTWIFDGDPSLSITPLSALRDALPHCQVDYVRALDTTRSESHADFPDAVEAASAADIAILFLGEEAVLSGEAHCRSDIRLPGSQEELIRAVRSTGTPVLLVILAGRPLALEAIVDHVDAILYGWHPGSMAGPALADLILGIKAPSGRLPVTFPRVTGQIPIYYAQRNTGRPATPETYVHMRDLPRGASQLSTGATSYHLDTHYTPLFPFGFGLTYTSFRYDELWVHPEAPRSGGVIKIQVTVQNTGDREGTELVQLYVRDVVASVTRPVRELKGFRHVTLAPHERRTVEFSLRSEDLAFPGRDMRWVTERGRFDVWVGGDAATGLQGSFHLL